MAKVTISPEMWFVGIDVKPQWIGKRDPRKSREHRRMKEALRAKGFYKSRHYYPLDKEAEAETMRSRMKEALKGKRFRYFRIGKARCALMGF